MDAYLYLFIYSWLNRIACKEPDVNVRRDSESQRTGVSNEMQGADVGAVDALVQRQCAARTEELLVEGPVGLGRSCV